MSESIPPTDDGPLSGKRFLWSNPELLTVEAHQGLGISPCETRFSIAANVRALPLTVTEFRSAQRDYPILFSDVENPMPIIGVGFQEDRNLFIDAEGRWEYGRYIPAYLRCHPFAIARASEDQLAMVIDRAAPSINDAPEQPFFVDGKFSKIVEDAANFCSTFDAEWNRTGVVCKRIAELGLLTWQGLRDKSSSDDPLRFAAVDVEKLTQLSKDDIHALHQEGTLAAIHAHLFSLDRWSDLALRQAAAKG